MDETAVVTGFLRNDADVLLFERSDDVGSYAGRWGAVAGHAEGDPDSAIRQEIREETGLDPSEHCSLVRQGESFTVTDEELGTRWQVHPYLFDCDRRDIEPNWETASFEWTAPTEILRRPTVPKLWQSYDAVRPGVETIASDSEHGSAYISIRALEVLRDECGLLADRPDAAGYDSAVGVARELLAARSSMTVVANRIHRVMAEAAGKGPAAVATAARDVIREALAADSAAASEIHDALEGSVVATLSRSGTVLQALAGGGPARVVVPESRPGREGIDVAEALASETDVVLTSDAGFAQQIAEQDADLLLVGADSLTADAAVVNKVGTRGAAAAAAQECCRVVVLAASDKISPAGAEAPGEIDLEPRERAELYDGEADISVANPTFDVTPSAVIDSIVTERGETSPDAVAEVAREHAQRRTWL